MEQIYSKTFEKLIAEKTKQKQISVNISEMRSASDLKKATITGPFYHRHPKLCGHYSAH